MGGWGGVRVGFTLTVRVRVRVRESLDAPYPKARSVGSNVYGSNVLISPHQVFTDALISPHRVFTDALSTPH